MNCCKLLTKSVDKTISNTKLSKAINPQGNFVKRWQFVRFSRGRGCFFAFAGLAVRINLYTKGVPLQSAKLHFVGLVWCAFEVFPSEQTILQNKVTVGTLFLGNGN